MCINQNDHGALTEDAAADLGDGRYRYTIPAGLTDAGTTRVTAVVDEPAFMTEGYATVDQTGGGMIASQPQPQPQPCSAERIIEVRSVAG